MRNCLEKFCLARETAEALKLPGVDWVAGTSVLEVCMVSSLESPASHSKEHLQGVQGGGVGADCLSGVEFRRKADSRQDSCGQVGQVSVRHSPKLEVGAAFRWRSRASP